MVKGLLGDAILIGLSDENVKRLKKGQPIKFNLVELGLEPRDVVIVHGKTEDSIHAELEKVYGKAGRTTDSRK